MADKDWSRRFETPITLADGRRLVTLRDAALHIQNLPNAEQHASHWQIATEILIGAAEGRDFLMHAAIGMRRALNHGRPKPLIPAKRAKQYRVLR